MTNTYSRVIHGTRKRKDNMEQIDNIDIGVGEGDKNAGRIIHAAGEPIEVKEIKIKNEEPDKPKEEIVQVAQLCDILNQTMMQMTRMMELITESIATLSASFQKSASSIRNPDIIQISTTDRENQINLLNNESKQNAEKYESTNILVVEIPALAEEHKVMKQLRDGVSFAPTGDHPNAYHDYHVQLGVGGFKRHVVQELLTEYPDLKLGNLVEAVLRSNNEWKDLCNKYYWYED